MHEEQDAVKSEGVLQTCLRDLTAHSSKVSAASSLPCRRYRAPRFLRVVFTVGLDTGKRKKKKISLMIPSIKKKIHSASPVDFAGLVPASVLSIWSVVSMLALGVNKTGEQGCKKGL